MSGGRLELGLGSGWFEREHRAMGIPFPEARERSERLEEFLEILNAWWATPRGATFTHAGKHFQLVDNPALPKPHQARVPLILGGWGPQRTPRLAARFADEFNLAFGTLADCRAQFDRVVRECEALDRDPATLRWSTEITVCCGESEAEAAHRADRAHWEPERLRTLPGRFIGSPDQLIERLQEHQGIGASTVYLQLLDVDDTDHVALIGERVLPAVAAL
jgi:alkanesulfonate monooxygenase SsuD/methylene tetrahydromethanopterin reductase-like flavin-dependent oxidoreductase (luciferase family)